MTALIVGALAIVAFLLFCVVVALGGALLAISAAEPPSPWDEEQSIPCPEVEVIEREDA